MYFLCTNASHATCFFTDIVYTVSNKGCFDAFWCRLTIARSIRTSDIFQYSPNSQSV